MPDLAPLDAIDPDATARRWRHEFEYHLDLLAPVMDAVVMMTLPQIPVSRGGSRFDRDQVTGGGYVDTMAALDHMTVTGDGQIVAAGAARDATDLWGMVVEYTEAVVAWTTPGEAPALERKPNPDPLSARGIALTTAGWLIDHADAARSIEPLEPYREELFALIRRLRGVYGVSPAPRKPRARCTTCGQRAVAVTWVDGANGSPRPVQVGKCRVCGETYREHEGHQEPMTEGSER